MKVAVGKVINMMNFLSPKTIGCILRGAASFNCEQKCVFHPDGDRYYYCFEVVYPNGYGASIFSSLLNDKKDDWELVLIKDGEPYESADDEDYIWFHLTEEDVIRHCDRIYFLR